MNTIKMEQTSLLFSENIGAFLNFYESSDEMRSELLKKSKAIIKGLPNKHFIKQMDKIVTKQVKNYVEDFYIVDICLLDKYKYDENLNLIWIVREKGTHLINLNDLKLTTEFDKFVFEDSTEFDKFVFEDSFELYLTHFKREDTLGVYHIAKKKDSEGIGVKKITKEDGDIIISNAAKKIHQNYEKYKKEMSDLLHSKMSYKEFGEMYDDVIKKEVGPFTSVYSYAAFRYFETKKQKEMEQNSNKKLELLI